MSARKPGSTSHRWLYCRERRPRRSVDLHQRETPSINPRWGGYDYIFHGSDFFERGDNICET